MEQLYEETRLPLHREEEEEEEELVELNDINMSSKELDRNGYFRENLKTGNHSVIYDDTSSLPSWVSSPANPQGGTDDPPLLRNTLVFTARKRKSTFSFTLMGFCLVGLVLYSSSRSTLRVALSEAEDLVAFSTKITREMKRAEREVKLLERELAALDAMDQKQADMEEEKKVLDQAALFTNPKVVQEIGSIQRKLKFSASRAEQLKEQVSKMSRQDTINKYGAGVQRVEIELEFPGNFAGPTNFVIELAPVDMMPHSVFTFLEMVSEGLLDGCSFILNALHVIKAAPLPFDGSPAAVKARAFTERGLESVAFREYSHDYPHLPFTVGFAADGTPSFYINTEDNTEIHVGDPCFGRVISGFDAVKRMENSPTRNGIWFEHRIGIKKAVIL